MGASLGADFEPRPVVTAEPYGVAAPGFGSPMHEQLLIASVVLTGVAVAGLLYLITFGAWIVTKDD
jgi:hypothetical protein